MVVEIPDNNTYARTFIFGTRVLLTTYDWRGGYRIQVYDFSRWGCRALVRVGDGERERLVMPSPKIWHLKEPNDGLEIMQALGDSLVMCTVGNIPESS